MQLQTGDEVELQGDLTLYMCRQETYENLPRKEKYTISIIFITSINVNTPETYV